MRLHDISPLPLSLSLSPLFPRARILLDLMILSCISTRLNAVAQTNTSEGAELSSSAHFMHMAISSIRTTRPRLGVLCEAAGAVLLRRPTALSSAWVQKKRALISALYRAPLHSPFNLARPSTYKLGTPVAPTPLHSPLPLVGRVSYSTSRTQLVRKASTKSASRVSAHKKSLVPGKVQKPGNNVRRSMTVLASSKQKVATSAEEIDNRRPLSAPKRGGVRSSTKTLLKSINKSEMPTDSRDNNEFRNVQKHSQRRTVIAKPTALNLRRSGAGVKEVTRSQEGKDGGAELRATSKLNTGSLKKGKRVMRLDPQDKTSKRLFEGYPLPGEEVELEAPVATTGRVQFRQIVPSPKLMQHIQKHMLGRRRPSELQRAGYDTKITPAPLDNTPHSKKGERQPIQEEVFRHKLRFAAAAKMESSFPPVDIPEVAFAGRSNVGKSSLINALTRQWGVARTSDKPGFTQSINFFRLGGRLCLVDLPGYGFAYAAEEKKEAWEELVKEFVKTRAGLKRVYVLVDAKWGLKLKDEELIELMEKAGTKYQIVLTKSDTVTPIDLARRATQVQEVFKNNKSLMLPMLMVSSKTGEGLEFFRANVARLAKASLI